MNKTQLAKALGISRSRLYQCIGLGCPTDSPASAKAWRDSHIDFTMTDAFRPGGNTGGKRKQPSTQDIVKHTTANVLTDLIPQIWFDQPGLTGMVLKDNGVKLTAGQLLKIQSSILMTYMGVVDDFLGEEATFKVGDIMMLKPEDEAYPSLIESLNQILEN
jgi:hypothetical protein